MTVIGFHCSHEQISPAQLLRDVQHAGRAGFTAGMSSDPETVEAFDMTGQCVTADYVEQGWDDRYLHVVGQHQSAVGEHVSPLLSPTPPATTAAMA